jgi:hypothetical protein
VLSATEDRKTTRIIHYFLTEISQYKFTNVAVSPLPLPSYFYFYFMNWILTKKAENPSPPLLSPLPSFIFLFYVGKKLMHNIYKRSTTKI